MTKKIFALFLVLALLFTGCGQQTGLSDPSGISSESTPPKGTHFSELVYTAPDLDETIQAYKTYAQKIQSAASAEEVISVWKDEAAFSKNYYDMYTLSYILFSLDTSNTQNSEQYEYMQEFLSKIKPAAMDFTRALCSSAYRPKLEEAFGENVLQSMQISVDQYTDEQLDLELQESKLSTEYVKLNSDKTVFETDEHAFTTSDLYYLVYSGDEENKQIAKSLLNEYYLELNRQSGEIFTQLMDVRTKIAKSAGFSNYLDYYYHNTSLSGYTRSDVENFRASVKKYLVPIYRDLKEEAAARLGQTTLDLFQYTSPLADLDSLSYREEITSADKLISVVIELLQDLSDETREMIDFMTEHELYDLKNSQNKRSGAFTIYFYGVRQPFVVSSYEDAGTYIHEMGHALNYYRSEDLPVLEMDLQSADISEIHSQSLELLAAPFLDRIYTDAALAEKQNVFEMFFTILSATLVDEFQHELYENPQMNHAERNALYARLTKEYYGEIDYLGLEYLAGGMDWTDIHHLFSSPLYYLEYALTAVVALNIWEDSTENWDDAFARYIDFVDIPNDVNLVDSLASANLPDIFSEQTTKDLADSLKSYLAA